MFSSLFQSILLLLIFQESGSSSSSSIKILFYIILLLIAYIASGMIYNQKVNNLSGMEAIPNKEFWKETPMIAKDGASFLFEKTLKQFIFLIIYLLENL